MNRRLAVIVLVLAALVAGVIGWRLADDNAPPTLDSPLPSAPTAPVSETVTQPEGPRVEPTTRRAEDVPPSIEKTAVTLAAPVVAAEATTKMYVRIVEDATALAIPGARIERGSGEQPELASDGRGLCSIAFTPTKSFSVSTNHDGPIPRGFCRVHAKGFGPAEFHEAEGHETEERALEIRLSQSATLAVTLLHRADTSAGAYVLRAAIDAGNLMRNDTALSLDYDFSVLRIDAACDAFGNARLEGLPANVDFTLSALLQGSEVWTKPELVRLKPGEERALDIELAGGCHVRAHVVDGKDESVPNVEVWLTRRGEYAARQFQEWNKKELTASGRSDDQGKLDFGEIPPGRYMIGLSPTPIQRYRPAPGQAPPRELTGINVEVEIADGERTRDLEVRVQEGLFIAGAVFLPDGTVFERRGLQVFCSSKAGHQAMTFTKSDGSFRCGPLVNARYELRSGSASEYTESLPVEADPGRSDVALVLRTGSGLVVRIAEFSGGPGVSAELILEYLDGSRTTTMKGSTPGLFNLTGLTPGIVSLAATSADCRSGVLPELELVAGVNREIELLLSPGAKLRIRSSDGAKLGYIKILQGGVTVAIPSGASDSAQVDACVPVGTVVVRRGKAPEQTVTLGAGEEREIVFEP